MKLPKRIIISLYMLLLLTSLLTLFRFLFGLIFYNEFSTLTSNFILKSFFLGFRFDLRLIIIIILTYLFLSWIPIINNRVQEHIWKIYWLFMGTVILISYITDFAYYAYLNTRLDASIIGLIKNFSISLMMVWESYPIIPGLILISFLLWVYFIFIKKIYKHADKINSIVSIWQSSLIHIFIIFLFLAIGYGKLASYPLRWSDAFYSTNHFANQLAINPILYFLNTYSWRTEEYDINNINKYYDVITDYIGVIKKNKIDLSFSREIEYHNKPTNNANVVIIILETFPNYKIGYFGNPLNPTPNFDSLAKESIIFTNFYVPKFSTAASVFSAMTGLPDMATVNKTSTNDPYSFKQHLLINDLKTYKKHFFIGGSANWADIGGFFRRNVNDISIYEEGSYSAKPVNAWGISDYDLLIEANDILKKEKEPFISIILTAGNHSPFTIPKINKFNPIKFTKEHKQHGFSNENELNAFRFMDFALGEFFRVAKEEDYYDNTIFVILGDHGIGHPSQKNNFGALSLHNFHVPLAIFSPGLNIKPRTINLTSSSIDLLPTIMGLLSVPYKNTTLGIDLLNYNLNKRYAFIFTATNFTYGLISNNYFITSNVMGEQIAYDVINNNYITKYNSEINYMMELNKGYYHISKYLRYHNE